MTPEVHPLLSTAKCTTAGGCVTQNTSVVLDFGYRWLHTADGYDSCTTSSGINSTLCPDEATCAQNCVVEGANYTAAGISTTGSSMTMNQYVDSSTGVSSASPRVYLLDESTQDYVMFQLLGQELTFDVDLSTLPCGVSPLSLLWIRARELYLTDHSCRKMALCICLRWMLQVEEINTRLEAQHMVGATATHNARSRPSRTALSTRTIQDTAAMRWTSWSPTAWPRPLRPTHA